jgi:hypothetical protein
LDEPVRRSGAIASGIGPLDPKVKRRPLATHDIIVGVRKEWNVVERAVHILILMVTLLSIPDGQPIAIKIKNRAQIPA